MAGRIPGPERRIVLVGKGGVGKSATGNTILGRKVFECRMSRQAVMKSCKTEETLLNGRKVVVVDTPGFLQTLRPSKDSAAEVIKWVRFFVPGPHVILHVMHPGDLSQEEVMVGQLIKEILGPYMIVLFTRRDDLGGESLENWISFHDKKLEEYVAECGNRMLAFENRAEGAKRDAQVAELMAMIDDLVERNRNAPCYTKDMMNVKQRRNLF